MLHVSRSICCGKEHRCNAISCRAISQIRWWCNVKQIQKQLREVLEPIDKILTIIISEIEKMREELVEIRKLNRDLVKSISSLKDAQSRTNLRAANCSNLKRCSAIFAA